MILFTFCKRPASLTSLQAHLSAINQNVAMTYCLNVEIFSFNEALNFKFFLKFLSLFRDYCQHMFPFLCSSLLLRKSKATYFGVC